VVDEFVVVVVVVFVEVLCVADPSFDNFLAASAYVGRLFPSCPSLAVLVNVVDPEAACVRCPSSDVLDRVGADVATEDFCCPSLQVSDEYVSLGVLSTGMKPR